MLADIGEFDVLQIQTFLLILQNTSGSETQVSHCAPWSSSSETLMSHHGPWSSSSETQVSHCGL